MKKFMERVCLGSLILLVPVSGFACSMAQWTSQDGAVSAASPPTLPRVSELCAMEATNTGYVHDSLPDNHTTFIARFYVRSTLIGSGQADVFVAYDNDTPGNTLLKVSYDGTNLDFYSNTGVQLETESIESGKWHLVEIEYNSAGQTRFWVNANAVTSNGSPTGTYASATGAIESVRLGLPNGRGTFTGGGVSFDAYESHSTTPVGPLLIGDADGNGSRSIGDYGAVKKDILFDLQAGQPDCNLSGSVSIADYGCVKQKILNPNG